MLSKNNFTEEHIRSLQTESRRDPLLLERCVYAFGLLEAIITVGMPFVFKGGTSDGVNLLSVNELQKYTLIKVFNFSIILLSFLFHVKIL